MGIILDSDIIIRAERGVFDLSKWIGDYPQEKFAVAAITIAELWHGVERATGRRRETREAFLQTVVSGLIIFPYSQTTARIHARLWAALQSAGTMIGMYDVVVAATAMEHACSVATFNQKHFQVVPGLVVIEPTV
jgi:tRNA(fMet)-specific endonuclease VapC